MLPLCAVLAISPSAGAQSGAGPGADPWQVLEQARERLVAAGGLTADFTQSFVPAGFSSGEQESGLLFIALPDCLRWDYADPYPKSFLICDETVHAWNPGEPSGRRSRIDAREEPGLDLMMLSVDRLRARYSAAILDTDDGEIEIQLAPTGETESFAIATLWVDPQEMHPVRLAYQDREGNRTTFVLSDYRPIDPTLAVFDPPDDLEWIE